MADPTPTPSLQENDRITTEERPPTRDTLDPEAGTDSTAREARRRRWPWIVLFVLAASVAAWYFLTTNGTNGNEAATASPTRFADVVQTDLIEVTTLDGTLGRTEGDPVRATVPGTITFAPEPGDTIAQGETLYEIDRSPVVLLYGELPAYRDLQMSDADFVISSRAAGTITWLPEIGTVVEQGTVLYEVNGEPVVALYGDTPAYRTMADARTNLTGDDILQLETALVALGYDADGTVTVDGEYTGFTAAMVEDWEESIGATVDGTVALGDVVFIPGPTEIASIAAAVGDTASNGKIVMALVGYESMSGDDVLQLETSLADLGFDAGGSLVADGIFDGATRTAVLAWQEAAGMNDDGIVNLTEFIFLPGAIRVSAQATTPGSSVGNGGAVLNVTSNEIVVSANLSAADQGLISVGDAVTVELPDYSTTPGTVSEIATVAVQTGQNTVFPVTIVLDDPAAAGALDEAPVEIQIVTDSVENVIAVPVTALLALREGGYAIEVASGETTRLVAVEPGFFADGMVEIAAAGIAPGDRVVIP